MNRRTAERSKRIEERLRAQGTPEPPAGLEEVLRRQIPEELELAPELSGATERGRSRSRRRYLLAAASVVVAVGTGVVGLRVARQVETPEALREPAIQAGENHAGDAPAEREGAPAPEPAATPQAAESDAAASLEPERVRERRRDAATGSPPAGPPSSAQREAGRLKAFADRAEGAPVPGVPSSAGGTAEPDDRPSDDVFSRAYGTDPFLDPAEDPLSTFGLDVDTGSWGIVRRHLSDGHLPPPEAVRLEEMVNALDYGDPAPEEGDFALRAEGVRSPFAGGPHAGRHHLVRFGLRAREARRGASEGLTGTLQTVARDARVQVELDPEVVERYRLLGYENRDVPDERFRDDTLDAEVGAGHGVTALYEVKLRPDAPGDATAATLRLRYRSAAGGEVEELELPVTAGALRRSWEEAPSSLRLAAVVAELAEILRGSHWAEDGDLDALFRRAQVVSAERPGDVRAAELASLVGKAAELRREEP